MATILLAGFYGFGNAGDEAILASIVADLRSRRPDLRLIVVSGDPSATEAAHAVAAVSWMDVERIVQSVEASDLVILGGGGLFHDYWGFDPTTLLTPHYSGIAFFASFPLLATLLDKPTMIYAAGVGPLFSQAGRDHTRAVFERASIATVRDPESRRLLKKIGLPLRRVRVTADPAFRLQPAPPERAREILRSLGPTADEKPLVGVALRNWNIGVLPVYWERQVAQALDTFLERRGGSLLFVPFQENREYLQDDSAVAERVRAQLRHGDRAVVLPEGYSAQEKSALIGGCDVVVGMRLHSLIFAVTHGVPAIGLVYGPKVRSVAEQAGIENYAIDLGGVTSGQLATLMDQALRRRTSLKSKLRQAAETLAAAAEENTRLAVDQIKELPGAAPADATTEILKRVALSHTRRLVALETQAQALKAEAEERRREIAHLRAEMESVVAQRDQAIAALRAELQSIVAERDAQIADLRAGFQSKADEHERRLNQLRVEHDTQLAERERLIADLLASQTDWRTQATAATAQLASITRSRGYGWLYRLWQVRLRLAPRDSRRERTLLWALRGLEGWHQPGLRAAARRATRGLGGMSWHAFAFDRYKRARTARYGADLSSLRCPSEPGLISIVLPAYNGAALIREALNSILRQTYSHFEVIAIDDGSTDTTGAILDEYARQDSRIRVIHQDNQKIPRALSRGFRLARGEFLTWTSCDNRLRPDFLDKMVNCLRRHPCWDMAYANIALIGGGGEPLRNSEWYQGYQDPPGSECIRLPDDVSELNTWPNNYVGSGFLYRDRVAHLLGDYGLARFTIEDYDYWMQVNALLTLRHADFDSPVYEYRFHDDSLTHRDDELGITRNRVRLMVFDDFRRDFYLSPLAWVIEADSCAESRAVAAAVRQHAEKAGHVFLGEALDSVAVWPRRWLPVVHVKTTSDPTEAAFPPADPLDDVFRVIVFTGADPLPADADAGWDMCVGMRPQSNIPRLTGDQRGWLVAPETAALFAALDIRARARHLRAVEAHIAAPPPSGATKLSVVICTHRQSAALGQVVTSVARQTLPLACYEIIVVDNAPEQTEARQEVAAFQASLFPNCPERVHYVACPVGGLAHARNAGLAEARGEVICFLDDDAIAEPSWLEQIWRAFAEHPDAGVVGGHIRLQPPDPKPPVLQPGWEVFWSQFLTGYDQYTEVSHWWQFPWGANWCARRQALLEVGGFRTRYGRRGQDYGGGEEIVAATLIQRLGYTIAMMPTAEVRHVVDPDRYTLRHVWRTILAATRVHYQMQRDLYLPRESALRSITQEASRLMFTSRPGKGDGQGGPAKAWMISLMRLAAHLSLFPSILLDYRLRSRQPVARLSGCGQVGPGQPEG